MKVTMEEKERESARNSVEVKESVKVNKGNGLWRFLKYAVIACFGSGSTNDDECTKAVAKLEQVFSLIK